MKKRLFALTSFILAASMMVSMTACSNSTDTSSDSDSSTDSSADSSTDTSTDSDEVTTITFMRAGLETEKQDAYMEMIELFEAENPQYVVEYSEVDWGDIDTKWNTAYAAGTTPDVVYDGIAKQAGRVALGQYESLNTYAEGWEGYDDIYASVIAAGTQDGELYGVGVNADARVFVCNMDMLADAGIDSTPTNWEELIAAHEALTVTDSSGNVTQCGFIIPTTGSNIQQFFQIFSLQNGTGGTGFVDADTDEVLIDSDSAIEAMETLATLNEIGMISWDFTSTTNPMLTETAAMGIMSEAEYVTLYDTVGDAIQIADMFGEVENATFGGIHMLSMSTQAEDKEGAWALIETMSSVECFTIWNEATGSVTLRDSMEADYLTSNPDNGQYFLDAVANGYTASCVVYNSAMVTILDIMCEEIYYGVSSVTDAIANAATELQAEIDNQ